MLLFEIVSTSDFIVFRRSKQVPLNYFLMECGMARVAQLIMAIKKGYAVIPECFCRESTWGKEPDSRLSKGLLRRSARE